MHNNDLLIAFAAQLFAARMVGIEMVSSSDSNLRLREFCHFQLAKAEWH